MKKRIPFLLLLLICFGKMQAQGDTKLTEYLDGTFIVNEDWFGHDNGSLNYIAPDNKAYYRVYSQANNNASFGTTTQYGTIYGDNIYFVSKQAGKDGTYTAGERLIVADAKTLIKKAGFNDIGGGQGRSFTGINSNIGYIATSAGICIFDIQNKNVKQVIEGTEQWQIGNIIATNDYAFAVGRLADILIIDTKTHTLKTTLEISGSNTLTQSKDGMIWVGTLSKLVRINPYTLEQKEFELPTDAGISGSWGAWNAGSLCAAYSENVLYWVKGANVIRYDIDNNTFNTSFFTLPQQVDENGTGLKYRQVIYGAGLRVDPRTNNLVITTTESGWGMHYQKNWIHTVNSQATLVTSIQLDDYYWFPALPLFPDIYAPIISDELGNQTIVRDTKIYLGDKVSDKDNLDAAILKNVEILTGSQYVEATIKADTLILKSLLSGTATIKLTCNSNGKMVSKTINVTSTTTSGIEQQITDKSAISIYPNPCTNLVFVDAQTEEPLSIYSATGSRVKHTTLQRGENQLDVSNLPKGIYYLKTSTETHKIIKK